MPELLQDRTSNGLARFFSSLAPWFSTVILQKKNSENINQLLCDKFVEHRIASTENVIKSREKTNQISGCQCILILIAEHQKHTT